MHRVRDALNRLRRLRSLRERAVHSELVAERRAMRAEVEGLRRAVAGVVDLATRRR